MLTVYDNERRSPKDCIDARAAWGQSFNDVLPFGTYQDEFTADRWLATAALIGQHTIGSLIITPELRLSYFSETSESYVDSLGVTIPSIEVGTGQLEFGPTFTWRGITSGGLSYSPFLTQEGIWTFHQENTANAISGAPGLADEGLRGRAGAGIDIGMLGGFGLSWSMFYDGIGEDNYESWGGRARVGVRF